MTHISRIMIARRCSYHEAEKLAAGERDNAAENTVPGTWYPLFKHMSDTYELTLLDGELSEIAAAADESRLKAGGRGDMVRWALVNALIHLDTAQLHDLGRAIAKRSGGTYAGGGEACPC